MTMRMDPDVSRFHLIACEFLGNVNRTTPRQPYIGSVFHFVPFRIHVHFNLKTILNRRIEDILQWISQNRPGCQMSGEFEEAE